MKHACQAMTKYVFVTNTYSFRSIVDKVSCQWSVVFHYWQWTSCPITSLPHREAMLADIGNHVSWLHKKWSSQTNTATLRIFHGTYYVVRCWWYWWTANFEWESTATVVNIKTAKPVYSIRPPKRQHWLPSWHVIRPVCNQLVCILANPVMLHRYNVQASPHMPTLNICGYDDTYQIVNR